MKRLASTIRLRGEVSSRTYAEDLLTRPGDGVIVRRGVLRSFVLACPDGCGDVLTINLDKRAGPAWRIYLDRRGLSLYPSVWRDSGCGSHFIVWRNRILWCDTSDESDVEFADDLSLDARVLDALNEKTFTSHELLADAIGELPWEVQQVCKRLVRKGLIVRARGTKRQEYRLRRPR